MSKDKNQEKKVIGLKIGDQNIDLPVPGNNDIFLDLETRNLEKK